VIRGKNGQIERPSERGEEVSTMTNNASRCFIYGLFFSFTTALFWGMLPVALKLSYGFSDPVTLTWLRFTVAGAIVWLWQKRQGKLGQFRTLNRAEWLKLAFAGVFLIINYTCYAWSLTFLTPDATQLCMQTSPLFLALGGWIFFKEYISLAQWFCFAVLFAGLILFFHPVFGGGSSLGTTALVIGVAITWTSSLAWSFYALLQKSLFAKLDASNILMFIYLFAMVVMLPFSSPSDLQHMSGSDMLIALFCCLNTIIAYGSFAKALTYWQTVQVSSMIAMTPVISFLIVGLCMSMGWWSDVIHATSADLFSVIGMGIVVLGAIGIQMIASLGSRRHLKISGDTTNLPSIGSIPEQVKQ
jgi:drug/metabolite transporter (DMT)-like permease